MMTEILKHSNFMQLAQEMLVKKLDYCEKPDQYGFTSRVIWCGNFMSEMRGKYRIDSNQPAIVRALREIGASVTVTAGLGDGFPDLVVGYNGINFLMEIKSGPKATFTDDECKWRQEWFGSSFVVTSPEEAIEIVRTNPQEMQV